MKFKDPKDKTIREAIDEIITTNQLGDPKDYLWCAAPPRPPS
jgi:hypothetical protein